MACETATATHPFTGGKIRQLFKSETVKPVEPHEEKEELPTREDAGHKRKRAWKGKKGKKAWANNEYYGTDFTATDAQNAFEDPETVMTLKTDGECAMLVRVASEDGVYRWCFHTRLDTRGKPFPPDHVPVPEGKQPGTFDSGKALHTYCFIPLKEGKKKQKKAHDETYGAIAQGVKDGRIPDPCAEDCPPFITCEWVGAKHQGGVDYITRADGTVVNHAIVIHGTTEVEIMPRTRERVAQMAREIAIEGVVFQSKCTGERFKIRFDRFQDSAFERAKKDTVGPKTTVIKPDAIFA